MSEQRQEAIKDWLQKRMTEENLSAEEISEFSDWLTSRSCAEHEKKQSQGRLIDDIFEFADWLKGRMKEVKVHPEERRELLSWLTRRVSDHTCISDEDYRRLHHKFDIELF